jgi:hypothetical protein
MKFAGLENPSGCRRRRKETLIHRSPQERPNMESPYVVSYKVCV